MKAIHAVGAVLALIVLSGVLAAQSPESVPPSENPAPSTLATSVSPCTEEQSSIDVLDDAGVSLWRLSAKDENDRPRKLV